jgi:hypothetical protein
MGNGMSNLHQLSDLEYYKLGQILDAFSEDCSYEFDLVVGEYNDEVVYLVDGRKVFKIDREYISPNIEAEDAAKKIVFFEER